MCSSIPNSDLILLLSIVVIRYWHITIDGTYLGYLKRHESNKMIQSAKPKRNDMAETSKLHLLWIAGRLALK